MARRILLLATFLLCGGPLALHAQYFGQNKVQYTTFDWQVIRTEHFEVHYYGEMRPAAMDAARMAERSYARLSRILQHEWIARKPLILYASASDFQQTNTTGGEIGEGTGGFTDFYRNRMVLPFTGSYDDFEHVLEHEMVHAFQYDVFSRGHPGQGFATLAQINPPLWFAEGMAEYLSIGPIAPHTAMWMRDAALNGRLPSLEQLTYDPSFFPYRFGHALWAYVGQKWGDETVGAILQATLSGGVERAFNRVLGLSLENLIEEWHEAVQNTYLPQVPQLERPRQLGRPVLTRRTVRGGYHLAPQISPDGRYVVYLSERNFIFVDLYMADVESRRVTKLVNSTLDPNYESLRFIYSTGSWSTDGNEFVFVSKSGGQDVLNIMDVRHREVVQRLELGFAGITNPSFSPDGQRIVFTGMRGGWGDLYLADRATGDVRRLTNDRYADLMPQWSPDGRTIAFSTDRGANTDFDVLRFGNLRIALYHVEGDSVELLPHMDDGKNVNPVWSPDGNSIAFISQRSGAMNVFMYDLTAREVYQVTNAYTGIAGITELSPAISWARIADRLVMTFYENGEYNVYLMDDPRSRRRPPWRADPAAAIALANASAQPLRTEAGRLSHAQRGGLSGAAPVQSAHQPPVPGAPVTDEPPPREPGQVGEQVAQSFYRGASGMRRSDTLQAGRGDSATQPLSVLQMLDSVELALPDTNEFVEVAYKPRYTADLVSRPTIGYTRDNFGRGLFGGAAVQFTDLLGDHSITAAGAVNGRIQEAQLYLAYLNLSRRLNWMVGGAQDAYYYYGGGGYGVDELGRPVLVQQLNRWVIRQAFAQAHYPINRFKRWELRLFAVNMDQATLNQITTYTPTGIPIDYEEGVVDGASRTYVLPTIAYVHDNSLFGYTSSFIGSRYRFELGRSVGGFRYTQAVADWRNYKMLGLPLFTLATRLSMFGRFGRDEDLFPMFVGMPDRVRGYTYQSFLRRECNPGSTTPNLDACRDLDRLIGSRMALANIELRFPLLRQTALAFLPIGLPPVEAAFFFDAGMAWQNGSTIVMRRDLSDSENVRAPVTSYGFGFRINMFGFAIMSIDYAFPQQRVDKNGYWIVSLQPPF